MAQGTPTKEAIKNVLEASVDRISEGDIDTTRILVDASLTMIETLLKKEGTLFIRGKYSVTSGSPTKGTAKNLINTAIGKLEDGDIETTRTLVNASLAVLNELEKEQVKA
jgi:hypothetical protein